VVLPDLDTAQPMLPAGCGDSSGENTRYDLVIDEGDRLAHVQCKDRPP
jgi:hypothetical protein